MVQYFRLFGLALLFLVGIESVAKANDSESAIGAGGLVYERIDDIQMLSEDLLITPDLVRVEYSYYNKSDNDLDILVSFPIPQMSSPSEMINTLNFRTWVDGQEISWFPVSNKPSVSGRATIMAKSSGLKETIFIIRPGIALPVKWGS